MAKLKCTSPKNVANTKIQFPLIGHVQFDKDAVINVDDKLVKQFLKIECGFAFEVVGSKSKDKEKDSEETVESETAEKDAYVEGLEELSKSELDALLSTHSEKETKGLKSNKAKIDYLVSKQFA